MNGLELVIENSVPFIGQGIPLVPPNGHNHSTSGRWIVWPRVTRTPELPEDALSPLFREPEAPLEPGEVLEEDEEYWAEGLWETMWEELNGHTWLMWQSDRNGYYDYLPGRLDFYKCPNKCSNRTRPAHSRKHRRNYHQIKQPGGSSCNQRR